MGLRMLFMLVVPKGACYLMCEVGKGIGTG